MAMKLTYELALSAQWAQRSEMSPCLSELSTTMVGLLIHFSHLDADHLIMFDEQQSEAVQQQHQMCRQETHLEVQLLGQGTVSKDDVISSPRNLSALGSLYRSVVSAGIPVS
jgi:exocyst complex component 4